jgi:hypothetical protein
MRIDMEGVEAEILRTLFKIDARKQVQIRRSSMS